MSLTYALLLKVCWGDHDHDVEEDVWVFLEKQVYLLLDCFFKLLSVAIRNAVPLLGFAIVTIVNRWQHEIFVMPAESRVFHSHIEPGNVNARDVVLPRKLHQRIVRMWQII